VIWYQHDRVATNGVDEITTLFSDLQLKSHYTVAMDNEYSVPQVQALIRMRVAYTGKNNFTSFKHFVKQQEKGEQYSDSNIRRALMGTIR
jgi:hypothetical protein